VGEGTIRLRRIVVAITGTFLLEACWGGEWACRIQGDAMYSVNLETGELGGAQRVCSCGQIRSFEQQQFGEVDEETLCRDFGC